MSYISSVLEVGPDILEAARLKAKISLGASLNPSEDARMIRILQDRQMIAKKSGLKAAKAMSEISANSVSHMSSEEYRDYNPTAVDSVQMREHFKSLTCRGCGNVTREKICEYCGGIK